MTNYVFIAFGDSIEIEADGFDIFDERKEALGKANEWLWDKYEFKADMVGSWFEMAAPLGFKWVPGNFFD